MPDFKRRINIPIVTLVIIGVLIGGFMLSLMSTVNKLSGQVGRNNMQIDSMSRDIESMQKTLNIINDNTEALFN